MKKIVAAIVSVVMLISVSVLFGGCSDKDTIKLYVYNWGEYISDGEEDTYDSNAEFEKWYFAKFGQKIKVVYDTYDSNEALRSRLETGAVNYDVVIPSDYMVQYFIEKDMLAEINFENIPNYKNISDDFRNLYYDPQNKYSVPYTYGVVGIIYDANEVDPADVTGWEVLWNDKYKGEILQFNNPRDAFGTAQFLLGLDVNSTDKATWDQAAAKLIEQKPLVKSYVMDEIYNMMETGEAAISVYYVGDYFTMRDEQADNVDLQFFAPENTNVFVDAMCILKNSRNKAAAEAYIDFMLSEEAGVANAEFIYYASPNTVVRESAAYKEEMGEEAYSMLYPEGYNFAEEYAKYSYHNLDSSLLNHITSIWENVKIK